MHKSLIILFVFSCVVVACSKKESTPVVADGLFERTYCNDPEAVNYNWNFPGTPDNSTCFYPTELFRGKYMFTDETYYATNFKPIDTTEYPIELYSISRTKLGLNGYCPGSTLYFTAGRFSRAMSDTTFGPDSVSYKGQIACRQIDTLSGYIDIDTNKTLRINFTVVTDTGVIYHIGNAKRQ